MGNTRTKVIIACVLGILAGFFGDIGRVTAQQLPGSAISVDVVMQQLQENRDLVLVDVREPQAFERLRIPGSLNIPLFAVKTKAFLTTKPVVLVDEGYRPHQLAEVCEQLMQVGFEAHFLFGGLNAWRTRSAPRRWASPSGWRPSGSVPTTRTVLLLHGDVFAQRELNRVPPSAMFAEQGGKYWLLIDVSASGEARSPGSAGVSPASNADRMSVLPGAGEAPALPGSDAGEAPALPGSDVGETPVLPGTLPEGGLFFQALSVPFDRDNPEPFLTHLKHAVADAAVRSERFLVLIYNQYGEDYEQIERVLQNADIAPVFFLQGGIEAYQKFWAQQESLKQAPAHSEKTLNACPCCR